MSALTLSGILFVLTLGGIFLGALLRRALPEHHLSDATKDVVRLGVGLIATIAALVLGLLIAAAKGSFDTQTAQVRQITADLILLDNVLAQYGPEARPVREQLRSARLPASFGVRSKPAHEARLRGTAPSSRFIWISRSSRRRTTCSARCNRGRWRSATISPRSGFCCLSNPRIPFRRLSWASWHFGS